MRSTSMPAESPRLAIDELRIELPAPQGTVVAVDGVTLSIGRGASVGLVGESGAGKSQLALAAPRLTAPGAILSGSIRFDGVELMDASPAQLRALRGASIGTVFQDPTLSLTPHLTVGTQLVEVLAAHAHGAPRRAVLRERACQMLARVRIADPEARLEQYPHELSGGLQQRVMLALALIAEPVLVIADEPTTALDATVGAGILGLLLELVRTGGRSLLLVSHDLVAVGGLCDVIAVMYAGRIVEEGPAARVLASPAHPYTRALVAARLTLTTALDAPIMTIAGHPPAPGEAVAGCAFAPRCPRAQARCRTQAPRLELQGTGRVACHRPLTPGESR